MMTVVSAGAYNTQYFADLQEKSDDLLTDDAGRFRIAG
jgi:hypothetical protein